MSLPCFLLKQSVDGCRLLWSLTHLHRLVLGKEEKMTPSRWLHSWWQWWLKLLTQFHMGSGHLRKAAGPDADDSEVYRIFDMPVVSTAMLLLLSARFAADSRGRKKNQQSKDAWSSALAALLAKYVPESDHEISIFLDTSVVLRMGIHCRGRHLVGLPVQNGLVDFSVVFSCQDAAVAKRLAVFGQTPPRKLTLADALVWLTNGGKQVQWLLSQFIHRLACTIEHAIEEQFSTSSATPGLAATTLAGQQEEAAEHIAAGREERQHQARLRKARTGIKPMQPMPLQKVRLKYFYAMRKKMATSRVLHVAFDASRVGGLSSLLGFMTNGAGGAAWLPPQVPLL